MKPRLLLSGEGKMPYYIAAFTELGAEITAQCCPLFSAEYDGLVLCGGVDIVPSRYGQPVMGSAGMNPDRDAAEFALAEAFIRERKPVLGICRGHQLLNVYFGGTLIQHLSTAEAHTRHEGQDSAHAVVAEGLPASLYGRHFVVNSAHHQAADVVGCGLRVTARAEDGTVEALEHECLPVFSVQWHPERMSFAQRREDTVDGAPLLAYFIKLCGKEMEAQ